MKNFTIGILILLTFPSFSQIDIGTLSEARYGIRSAIMGDTIIFTGGDDYDSADFFTVDDGIVDTQFYGSDGFTSAKVIVNDDIAFFYDITGVNLVIRDFYKYDKTNNEWTDGKYNVLIEEDVLFLDGDLMYSYHRVEFDSVSVFNIRTNESYKIESNLPVREFTVVEQDHLVYCVGGITEDGSNSNALNIYNKNTKEWISTELKRARREPTVLIHNDILVINGGFNNFSDEVEVVDLNSFECEIVELPQSNRDGKLVGAGDVVLVAGGSRNHAVSINLLTLEVGDPYVLEEEANLSGLDFLQGVGLGDEIILGGDRFPRFHIYNTKTDTWSVVPIDAVRRNASMFKHQNRAYFVGGRDSDDNNSDAITVFENTSSITEADLLNFNIYPNPSSDFLKIDFDGSESITVKIFSNSGELLISNTNKNEIDLSNLNSGFYFVTAKIGNDKTVVRKLIVE